MNERNIDSFLPKFLEFTSITPAIDILEKDEAKTFDKEALNELKVQELEDITDEDLYLSHERVSMHLNFSSPPVRPYRYALYQLQNLDGKRVLDYCSGSGETSVIIAKKGAEIVESFDISPVAVNIAKRRMKVNQVDKIVNVKIMSAYSMEYLDDYFDIVYGNAVLHHLDLKIAIKEIWRVLKPGGKAIFCEPFAGSRSLQFIRSLIPIKANLSLHERQLQFNDINTITMPFSVSCIRFFGLLSRLDRILNGQLVVDKISTLDFTVLKTFPFLRKFARIFVVQMIK